MGNRRRLFLACFAIVIGIISWRDITECHDLPFPPRFIATGIVFGMLDLLSGVMGDLAPLVGVGIVLAALVNNTFTHPDCNARLANSTAQPASFQVLQQGGTPGTTTV